MYQLWKVVENLTFGLKPKDIEIIVCNDGSIEQDGTPFSIYPDDIPWSNTKIINNERQWGVGYSFDRMAEIAEGEWLVIMGADVVPQFGWSIVTQITEDNHIGCATSVGLQPGNYDINKNFGTVHGGVE
jgi:glycosyltransferase involved in cell wall biosynthesis